MNKLLIKKLDFRQRLRGYAHSASVAVPAFLLLCALAGGSCTKEINDAPGGSAGGGTHDVTIALSPSLDNVVDVKAYNSWHNATDVRNLWIIQLSTDGTKQLCEPRYVTSFRNAGGQYRCEASLVKGASQVIFLANTNNPSLVPATGNTLASIQNLNYAFSSGVSKGGAIPAFATWTGTVDRFKTISATLTRTSALLDLTIRTDELPDIYTVTMNEIRIEQMPMAIHYLFPKNATPYPDANESFGRLVGLSGSVTQDLTKKTFNKYFDISPNVRGSGTAREPKDKNASTCPTGESNRCGYVNVRFNIATTDGAFSETENVRIYLGQNATNDFNIYPGDIIKLTLNIKGFKKYDTRISGSNMQTKYLDYPLRWSRIEADEQIINDYVQSIVSVIYFDRNNKTTSNPGAVPLSTYGIRSRIPILNQYGWFTIPRIECGYNNMTETPQTAEVMAALSAMDTWGTQTNAKWVNACRTMLTACLQSGKYDNVDVWIRMYLHTESATYLKIIEWDWGGATTRSEKMRKLQSLTDEQLRDLTDCYTYEAAGTAWHHWLQDVIEPHNAMKVVQGTTGAMSKPIVTIGK